MTQLTIPLVSLALLAGSGEGEITPKGKRLAGYLDGLQVEKHWLPGKYVHWESGKTSETPIKGAGSSTHCSAFVAGACARLGVYILRPPEHQQILLANAQYDWLGREGEKHGWHRVQSPWEAQRLANQGQLVVAVYKDRRTKVLRGRTVPHPGHIAVVRPSTRDQESVEKDGPEIIQAGRHNHNSTVVKVGFGSHPGAWGETRGVRFYTHKLEWK